MLKRFGLCAAALLFLILGSATQAQAALVQFSTTGAWGSSGTDTAVLTGSGGGILTIKFTGQTTTILTPSQVPFGFFITSGTSSALETYTDTFVLTITQTIPTPTGTGTFSATLLGTLRIFQSHAYMLFANPTVPVVIGGIKYIIIEADEDIAGRANLNAPQAGGAPSDPASVEGKIVPEPASMLLLGLGFLGSAAAARRRMAR